MHVYYYIHIFMFAGMSEDMTHKLRSILAQYEYVYQVCKWHDEGVLFRSHIYVPELHPITKFTYCEREDEAHVLKVCIHMMRYAILVLTINFVSTQKTFTLMKHNHACFFSHIEDCQSHAYWRTSQVAA